MNTGFTAAQAARIRDRSWVPLSKTVDAMAAHAQTLIEQVAASGGSDTLWEVPMHLSGHPSYDRALLMEYLQAHLKQSGFYVVNAGNALLFISWRHIEPGQPTASLSAPVAPGAPAPKRAPVRKTAFKRA